MDSDVRRLSEPSFFVMLLSLYGPAQCLWWYNTRRQFKQPLYNRLTQEEALDDWTHSKLPLEWGLSQSWFRTAADSLAIIGPLAVLGREFLNGRRAWGLTDYVLEFGALALYKQLVCIATRLPPAVQHGNIRHICGFPVSSWIDYGISGHTGIPVLLFLHYPSVASFILAVIQSVGMAASRDHYTIDVLHAWTFSVAVVGKFSHL
eukprot:TRINITY_DN38174_c0_g1_i1.p1 TRINITY_DN38174_c0_g1~~TRINITY_DN38174_c0_g1_i1.p1  ORF type:complete len:205 (+),score=16.86 TRINITY_DN38174_c0_g1_i1:107-721(+)